MASLWVLCAACINNGVDCPQERQCPLVCCSEIALCIEDPAGNASCAVRCAGPADCAANTPSYPCCEPLRNRADGGVLDYGICVSNSVLNSCICTSASDCATGCCSPHIDSLGHPVGPYLCKPNDGAGYHCCNGSVQCDAGCCLTDPNGSSICATPCSSDGQCSNAHCVDYASLPSGSSCGGTKACGP
jgi:hypothetical protein